MIRNQGVLGHSFGSLTVVSQYSCAQTLVYESVQGCIYCTIWNDPIRIVNTNSLEELSVIVFLINA